MVVLSVVYVLSGFANFSYVRQCTIDIDKLPRMSNILLESI